MSHSVKSKFYEAYPLLMAQKGDHSFVRFGLEVGPGWYPLIFELFGFLEDLQNYSGKAIEISQVKEKFGSLRSYLNCAPEIGDDVDLLESLFESLSIRICDVCGEPGRRQPDEGYWCTRCDEHRNTHDDEVLRKAAEKSEKDFLFYKRQGVVLSDYVYLKAVKSSMGKRFGTLTLIRFPDRLESIPEGLMGRVTVQELADRPVDALAVVVKELESQKKRLFGTGDGSAEADVILGRPNDDD